MRPVAFGLRLPPALASMVSAFRAAFDGYRPERHYMRGPGPKCAARRRAEWEASRPSVPAAEAGRIRAPRPLILSPS